MNESLFNVYKVENGFVAVMSDNSIVVGMSMSECCTAAQGRAAEIVVEGKVKKEQERLTLDELMKQPAQPGFLNIKPDSYGYAMRSVLGRAGVDMARDMAVNPGAKKSLADIARSILIASPIASPTKKDSF